MQLFKTPPVLEHEKVAVPFVKMTAATDRWPQVLVQSLLQQVPYLQEFDNIPSITQLDGAQGYGFGFITVRGKTNRPMSQLAGPKPIPHIRVPFIIKDWRLLPFDLFMRAEKVYPLTEKRVREAMYNTEVFDGVASSPGDKSISQDLMPPGESTSNALFGYGRAKLAFSHSGKDIISQKLYGVYEKAYSKADSGDPKKYPNPHAYAEQQVFKTPEVQALAKQMGATGIRTGGSEGHFRLVKKAKPRFLCEVLGQIGVRPEDLEKCSSALQNDATLSWYFDHHETAGALLNEVRGGLSKEASAPDFVPAAVQILRKGGQFILKSAQRDPYLVHEQTVTGMTARGIAGNFDVMKLADGESYTVSTNPSVTENDTPYDLDSSFVKKAGWCGLWTDKATIKLAHVFTDVYDLNGEKLQTKLAHDRSSGQVDVRGDYVIGENGGDWSKQHYWNSDMLEGEGFFVDPKTASVTIPFRIETLAEVRGEPVLFVKTATGLDMQLNVTPNIHGIVKTGQFRAAVPSHFVFVKAARVVMPLATSLGIEKKANVGRGGPALDILGDREGVFYIRGPQVEDIDKSYTEGIKEADARLLLGALGVSSDFAQHKLAWAKEHHRSSIKGVKSLTVKVAASPIDCPPSVFLLKEAMEVDDADTVDKLLGLNFLRPENVQMYVDYLPELDDAVCKLGDLLFGARVGLKPLSEDAVRRALFALEETVQGLRTLAQMGSVEAA